MPGAGLAARSVERRGDATERSGRGGSKGQGVEVRPRLLEPQSARRSIAWICCHEGADGELRERDGRDEGCRREGPRISYALEQNRAGVEDASARDAHRDESRAASMSLRRDVGSIAGRRDHRSMSTSTESGWRSSGTRRATGLPSLVTVIRSPRAIRSTMSPPWLRSSRIEISLKRRVFHA